MIKMTHKLHGAMHVIGSVEAKAAQKNGWAIEKPKKIEKEKTEITQPKKKTSKPK